MTAHSMVFPYLTCAVFPGTSPVPSGEVSWTSGPKTNKAQKDMTPFLTGLEMGLVKEHMCLARLIK